MPTERIAMRHVREVARRLGVAPSTVRETLRRFEVSGVEWPLSAALSLMSAIADPYRRELTRAM
jgi:transposase-like protein